MTASAIDVHTHVVPVGLPFGHGDRFPSLVLDGPSEAASSGRVMVRGELFRTVRAAAWNVGARIEDMDRAGVAFQVLSPMPELFSYWAEPVAGASFCAAVNEGVASMVAAAPHRFAGFGIVPLQDVSAAVDALAAIKALGLLGVEIGSNILGESVGSMRYLPFFDAAARHGLAVFVHAFHPPYWGAVADGAMSAAVNFPAEIGTALAVVVANGLVERCPGLRLGASHGGGTLPLHLPRMAAFWSAGGERVALSASPQESMRSIWFDCLTYEPRTLYELIALVGAKRVFVGSDYPFFDKPPGYVVDEATALAPDEVIAIRTLAALSFLGLSSLPVPPHLSLS